jgi:hypothetical protein
MALEISNVVIPQDVRRLLIDTKEMMNRCEEELTLVQLDMLSTFQYYENQHHILKSAVFVTKEASQSSIIAEGLFVEARLTHLANLFMPFLNHQMECPTDFRQMAGIEVDSNVEIKDLLSSLVTQESLLEEMVDIHEDDLQNIDDDDDMVHCDDGDADGCGEFVPEVA